jgi:hypothetical protein
LQFLQRFVAAKQVQDTHHAVADPDPPSEVIAEARLAVDISWARASSLNGVER